jgi:hypothetical protein
MGAISGQGTTFNLPNYHGELLTVTPTETPLLSAAGGLNGGEDVASTIFEWQTEDLRDPDATGALEGANAPTAEARSRANISNVVQIFHRSVDTSYTKQATTAQYNTATSAPYFSADGSTNPVTDEHTHQVMLALKTMARDINYAFWHGVQAKPSSNSTARQTAGLLSVVTTNRTATGEVAAKSASTDTVSSTAHGMLDGDKVIFTDVGASTAIRPDRVYYVVNKGTDTFKVAATLGGAAITIGTATVSYIEPATALTVAVLEEAMQGVYDNGGISGQGTATLFCSSAQRRKLTAAYANEYGKTDLFGGTRAVGGVAMDTIITNFGLLNVVIDRALAPDTIAVVSLEQVRPVWLPIPGKGRLFEEEIATVGSSKKSQIYGEIGLKYGNPLAHGVLRGLAV